MPVGPSGSPPPAPPTPPSLPAAPGAPNAATPPGSAPGPKAPSSAGYWIGGVVLVVGSAVAAVWLVTTFIGVFQAIEDYPRWSVPGSRTVQLDGGTDYQIFVEYPGADTDVGQIVRLGPISVTDDAEHDITVTSPRLTETYSWNGYDGRSVAEFTPPTTGRYTVGVGRAATATPSGVQVAVGRGIVSPNVGTVLGVLALGAVSLFTGVVLVVVTAVRRGRWKRANRPPRGPYPGGYGAPGAWAPPAPVAGPYGAPGHGAAGYGSAPPGSHAAPPGVIPGWSPPASPPAPPPPPPPPSPGSAPFGPPPGPRPAKPPPPPGNPPGWDDAPGAHRPPEAPGWAAPGQGSPQAVDVPPTGRDAPGSTAGAPDDEDAAGAAPPTPPGQPADRRTDPPDVPGGAGLP